MATPVGDEERGRWYACTCLEEVDLHLTRCVSARGEIEEGLNPLES